MSWSQLTSQLSLRKLLWRVWHFDLTVGGRILLAAIFFSGLAGCMTFLVPIYNMFIVLVFLYVTCYVASLLMHPRIRMSGSLPEKAMAGQRVDAEFTLTNRSRLPVFDLSLLMFSLPEGLRQTSADATLARLGPRRSCRVAYELLPLRRGQYELDDLYAYSTFPFNLFRRLGTTRRMGSLLVLPSFSPLQRVDAAMSFRYQPGGIAFSSKVGESPEYIGSREFRPGDSPRRIDFRSWARLAAPAVKEYQEEYYCRVALVLDTFVEPRRKAPATGFPDLEAAVSLSAAVTEALSRGEFIIDIFAAGPELYVFRAGRHTAHFENILEILACVDRCPTAPFDVLGPAVAGELNSISTIICLMLDWDESRRQFVLAAAEAGCRTKVVVIRDGETTLPISDDEKWAGPIAVCRPEDITSGRVQEI